jgi:hypothetical protein
MRKKDLKKYFQIFLSAVLAVSSLPVKANDIMQSGQKFDVPSSDMIELPVGVLKSLEFAKPGTEYFMNYNDSLVKATYVGMYDVGTSLPCMERSQTCFPAFDKAIVGPSIVISNEGGYLEKPPTGSESKSSDVSANLGTSADSIGSTKESLGSTGSADGKKDANEGGLSRPGKNEIAGKNQNGNSNIGNTVAEVGTNAAGSALAAGARILIMNYFGATELRRAMEKVQIAKNEYYSSSDALNKYRIQSISEAMKLTKTISTIEKANPIILPGPSELPQYNNDQKIDISALTKNLNPNDSNFQSRLKNVVNRLNNSPSQNEERQFHLKVISKSAVNASVESRLNGWFDVSDTQMSIAETAADLLYGLDPLTGTHRGLYELFTGKNVITGRSLTNFERGFSGAMGALSLVSLGTLPTTLKAFKAVSMIARSGATTGISNAPKAIMEASKVISSFKKLGIIAIQEVKSATNILKQEMKLGKFNSAAQMEEALVKSIASGEIKKVTFNLAFKAEPYSQKSLEFIKNSVSGLGTKAAKIYPGNTKDIYIIGRRMGDVERGLPGVLPFENAMIEAGYEAKQIHVFEPSKKAIQELKEVSREYHDGQVPVERLKTLLIWPENGQFMKDAVGTLEIKPTIIDTGRIPMDPLSHFYDGLEQTAMTESGRNLWK